MQTSISPCHKSIIDQDGQLILLPIMMIYEEEPCPVHQPKGHPTPVKLLQAMIDKRLIWFHGHVVLFTVLGLDVYAVDLRVDDSNPCPGVLLQSEWSAGFM